MTDPTYVEIVRNIISEVLRIPVSQIEDDSDLFSLGLDSILVIQIVARMNQLGLKITPRDLFVFPSVAGLTAVIRDKKTI